MTYENLQVSVKTNRGTLVNITGKDAHELRTGLDAFREVGLEALLALEETMSAAGNLAAAGVIEGTATNGETATPTAVQAGAQTHPAGKSCPHGVLVYKEGQKKAGGTWKKWACPANEWKNPACKDAEEWL